MALVCTDECDLVGRLLDGRYYVIEKIGRGGMGIVYRAEQRLLSRQVAVKVLSGKLNDEGSAIKRFRKEARAIAALRSEHTVTVFDMGVTSDGLLYYAMDLLEGQSLAHVLLKEGVLGYHRAADIALQVCASLEEAHRKSILHRDIKPENIFLSPEGGGEHVTVLDFGLAKLIGDFTGTVVTQIGAVAGTPEYMSPEQATGEELDGRTDLYSLGVVLYTMLTGTVPFSGDRMMATMLMHVEEPLVPVNMRNPNANVPGPIEAFVTQAMAKDRNERFSTVQAFRAALSDALALAARTGWGSAATLYRKVPSAPGVQVAQTRLGDTAHDLDAASRTVVSPTAVRRADTVLSMGPAPHATVEEPVATPIVARTAIVARVPSAARSEHGTDVDNAAVQTRIDDPSFVLPGTRKRSRRPLLAAIFFGVLVVCAVGVAKWLARLRRRPYHLRRPPPIRRAPPWRPPRRRHRRRRPRRRAPTCRVRPLRVPAPLAALPRQNQLRPPRRQRQRLLSGCHAAPRCFMSRTVVASSTTPPRW